MIKLGSICLVAGVLCAAGAALAADRGRIRRSRFSPPPPRPAGCSIMPSAWTICCRRPAADRGPSAFDKAHPYVPNNFGAQSTYRVADLSNPILQDWLKPSMKKANDEVLAGKVPFRARERCWPVGVPGFDAYSLVEPFYFYETPEKIVVINQGGPEIRHIYMNVPHSKNVKPSWYGESVGHYENGDTLVIDTIGQNDKTFTDNYRTPHTDQIHVVERWKLAADAKTVDVSVSVEDPGAFTTPWTAVQRWRRVEEAPILQVPATRTTTISSTTDWCRCPKPRNPIFDLDAPANPATRTGTGFPALALNLRNVSHSGLDLIVADQPGAFELARGVLVAGTTQEIRSNHLKIPSGGTGAATDLGASREAESDCPALHKCLTR